MTLQSTTSNSRWCTEFGLLLAIACPLAAQSRCVAPPPGVNAWFTFDEPLFEARRVPGLVGSALRLNGKDQYIEVPTSTTGLNVGEDDFSIELWLRTTDSKNTPSIVDKRDHRPVGYLIFTHKGHPGLQLANGAKADSALAMSISVADGRWHHVAGVVQRLPPGHGLIYVDGARQPQETQRNVPLMNLDAPVPLWLGRHHPNREVNRDDIYFQGDIDELTFYHRALTAAEIQSIFRAGARGKCRR